MGSHAGAAGSAQSVLLLHATHAPAIALHSGVFPAHCVRLLIEHWPQSPLGWHAGAPLCPTQPASLAHCTHILVCTSHAGRRGLVQSAFTAQPTQRPRFASQCRLAPHRLLLVSEHSPHVPFGWQAGPLCPMQPASAAHFTHVLLFASQVGVATPVQSAFARQATHLPATSLHTGVWPAHSALLVAEHCPHVPPGWQA